MANPLDSLMVLTVYVQFVAAELSCKEAMMSSVL